VTLQRVALRRGVADEAEPAEVGQRGTSLGGDAGGHLLLALRRWRRRRGGEGADGQREDQDRREDSAADLHEVVVWLLCAPPPMAWLRVVTRVPPSFHGHERHTRAPRTWSLRVARDPEH